MNKRFSMFEPFTAESLAMFMKIRGPVKTRCPQYIQTIDPFYRTVTIHLNDPKDRISDIDLKELV